MRDDFVAVIYKVRSINSEEGLCSERGELRLENLNGVVFVFKGKQASRAS